MSDQRPEMSIPKWMPSDDERIAAARISAFDGMYYRTGLRAQIAVLEQLSERWSIRSCACGLEVLRRISDLRKELEP